MSAKEEFITIIKPKKGMLDIDWSELWKFRELFFILVWRDVKVKYKQSALGVLWAIIVPLIQMIIFTVLFGRVAKLPTDGADPQIFYFSGLILWTYFSTAVTFSSNSLVASKNLLTKIYFPRLIMPSAPALAAFIDFLIAFVILAVLMLIYQTAVDWTIVLFPLFAMISMITATGTGFLFSALNVKFRDIGFALPFIIQIWQYGTVVIPYSAIPETWGIWKYLYGLNPMAGAVEGFRWVMLHKNLYQTATINGEQAKVMLDFPFVLVGISIVSMVLIFFIGLSYFRRMEDTFADIV